MQELQRELMLIPYDLDEESVFIDIAQEINARGYLTSIESLYVTFFTLDFLIFYDKTDRENEELYKITQMLDNTYYDNPLSIEREIMLRRLVKQYQMDEIPSGYIDCLKPAHQAMLRKFCI